MAKTLTPKSTTTTTNNHPKSPTNNRINLHIHLQSSSHNPHFSKPKSIQIKSNQMPKSNQNRFKIKPKSTRNQFKSNRNQELGLFEEFVSEESRTGFVICLRGICQVRLDLEAQLLDTEEEIKPCQSTQYYPNLCQRKSNGEEEKKKMTISGERRQSADLRVREEIEH